METASKIQIQDKAVDVSLPWKKYESTCSLHDYE